MGCLFPNVTKQNVRLPLAFCKRKREDFSRFSFFRSIQLGQNGGKRAGAGRKKGQTNALRTELAKQYLAWPGQSPGDFLRSIVQNESKDDQLRIDAAKAAMKFCHRPMPEDHEHQHTGLPDTINFTFG